MSTFLSDDILKAWHHFLQEVELAKNYQMPYSLNVFGGTFRNPLLEYLLPSLLYIKMITILDEALAFFINHCGYTGTKKKYPDTLFKRIEYLEDQGRLTNGKALHHIRLYRNDLAHEVSAITTWEKLAEDIDTVESELQHLGFVGNCPDYEFFAERSAARACNEPGVAFAHDFRFGIKCNNRPTMEFCLTKKTYNSRE